MWCAYCHYGSEHCSMSECPKCHRHRFESKRPFPDTPIKKGNGHPKNKKKNLTADNRHVVCQIV